DAPGASVVASHTTAEVAPLPSNASSSTATSEIVTLPALVTRNVNVTTSPAWVTPGGKADFSISSTGPAGSRRATESGSEATVAPPGSRPVATAVLVSSVASTSSWVTT